MFLLLFCKGFVKVLLWFRYGFAMALLWLCNGFVMVLLWFCHDSAVFLIWFCNGFIMIAFVMGFSWFCLGAAWFRYGFVMVLSTVGYWRVMASLQLCYGFDTGCFFRVMVVLWFCHYFVMVL